MNIINALDIEDAGKLIIAETEKYLRKTLQEKNIIAPEEQLKYMVTKEWFTDLDGYYEYHIKVANAKLYLFSEIVYVDFDGNTPIVKQHLFDEQMNEHNQEEILKKLQIDAKVFMY